MKANHAAILILIALLCLAAACHKKTTEPNQVAAPVITPAAGSYPLGVDVSITCATEGSEIRFTLDGSVPGKEEFVYSQPFQVSRNTTLKVRAFKDGYDPSPTVTVVYEITDGGMVNVSGGTFDNGASDVTISDFQIGRYEVTQSSYLDVMGSNPSSFPIGIGTPVNQVTWYDAIEYCNRRSLQEGLAPCYSYDVNGTDPDDWPEGWNSSQFNHTYVSCDWNANGYRLPTEMEWLYAARGGSTDDDYVYSGSDSLDAVGWFYGNSSGSPHEVGIKAPNQLGLYDMSGNLWEWCWDIFGNLPTESQTDPTGAVVGDRRCNRGGSWGSLEHYCRLVYREQTFANWFFFHQGFRVCRRI
jgi:formylglycine-generating enzyme required for sulfatase activity